MSENIQKYENENKSVALSFSSLAGFEAMQRGAKLLAASTIVPKDFQGNISNCVIALNMANRMNADPLMVMQNLYMVHGKPSFSSSFLVATFNTCGRFSALRYKFVGEKGKDNYGCFAWTYEKETGEKLEGSTITIEMAKAEGWYGKNGSKWKTMSEQMLRYRAAAFFIRAFAPEIANGMHTSEEIEDAIILNPAKEVQQEIDQNANKVELNFDDERTQIEPSEPEIDVPQSDSGNNGHMEETLEEPGF